MNTGRIAGRPPLHRLLANGGWALFGAGASQGLTLFLMIYIGRTLGPDNLGRFGVVQTTVNLLGSLAGTSLGLTSTKYAAQFGTTDALRAGRTIGLAAIVALGAACVMSLALFAAAPALALAAFHSSDMTGFLRIGAIWAFTIVVNAEQLGVLAGLEKFEILATLSVIRGLLMIIIAGAGVATGGVKGAITGFTLAACLHCMISAKYVRDACRRAGIPVTYFSSQHEIGVIVRFSLPAFLSSAIALPVNWIATILLVNQVAGYSHLGIFNAATHWRAVVSFVPAGLAQVGLPLLAAVIGKRAYQEYRKAVSLTILGITLSSVTVAGVLCAALPLLVRLYGPQYAPGKPVFLIVIATAVVSSLDSAFGLVFSSLDHMWPLMALTTLWAILTLVLASALIPGHGAIGLASAFLGGYALEVIIRGLYCHHYLARLPDEASYPHQESPTFKGTDILEKVKRARISPDNP